MRIYLDSNVLQDLKESKHKELYDLIISDKDRNIYYYSEAHIQDLVQDPTDHKLHDMDFMETIVGGNSWRYDKDLVIRLRSPKDYYHDFQWDAGTDILTNDAPAYTMMRESFRTIPLPFASLIDPTTLPADFPDDMRPMLLESTNMLEFMEAMLDLPNTLSEEQSRFKRLLQYLHRSAGLNTIYEKVGIKGYDGLTVTDWDAFATSFKEVVSQSTQDKSIYSLFTQMQFSLEVFGIVKGKPKKQKFRSLLNDGKHAFYAGHAHILVTSDTDMIAKTKMLYKIWGIATEILTPEKFKQMLLSTTFNNNSVEALFEEFGRASNLPTIYEEYTLAETLVIKGLDKWFLGEFNVLNCSTADGYTFYYFNQVFAKLISPTLRIEVERVVNLLSAHFGLDESGRGKLDHQEFEDGDWKGRQWLSGEMGIFLYIKKERIILSFFKAAPRSEKPVSD